MGNRVFVMTCFFQRMLDGLPLGVFEKKKLNAGQLFMATENAFLS